MAIISSQTFTFAPPQQGAQYMTQAGPIANVPLDGSSSITVPFPQGSFTSYVGGVTVTYAPGTDTGYMISTEVLPIAPATNVANSLNGFVLVARGGPANATGSFTFTAYGI